MPEVEDTDSGVLRIGVTRKPPEWLTLPEKAQGAETRTRKTRRECVTKT